MGIDTYLAWNLFVTGGLDCHAKIWNLKKEMIREIKVPEKIFAVAFLNEKGDVLIGHNAKVSTVETQDYRP
jgi:hypothetical protein